MRRLVVPGAESIAALPSGEYAASIPSEGRLETHFAGRLPLPLNLTYPEPVGLHYVDFSPTHERFMGQAHSTPTGVPPRILEWRQIGGWREVTDVPVPTGRARYDLAGRIVDLAPAGSQYLEERANLVIPRIETSSAPFHGLSEWVKLGDDLYIGQGHDSIAPAGAGGVLLWNATRNEYRRIDNGVCVFIGRHVEGQTVALFYVKSRLGGVILLGTIDEFRDSFPLYTPLMPAPAPIQVPGDQVPAPVPPPAPQPAPAPKEAVRMVVYGEPLAGFSTGETVPNADGTVSVKKANGKFLCVTPDGGIEERESGGGPWESFRKGRSTLMAEREGGRVYILPFFE